ncbi:MAG: aldehyde dehydrogenase family protein [Chloroflexi bacterium]|nr:aldehyde dehydrogenase family protein [Chloroflexota bacterium]
MDGRNYINGEWVPGSGPTFETHNPASTGEVLGAFPRSGPFEADSAVEAARAAYPAWSHLSRIRRAEYLWDFCNLARAQTEELATLLARESGKVMSEARADIVEGIHMAQFVFGRARMSYGDVVASEIPGKDAFALRKPKGVVVAITPWNFPFAIPVWLIAPSLLEGNTVAFKPAEETPLLGQKIVELFHQAGLPKGVLNLVQGYGEDAGWPLVTHPDVNVILFTGSYEVGSRIRQAAAKDYNKLAACEMGGKNAVIVLDDADLKTAVNASVMSAFRTTGQRCTAASRLIVHEKILSPFKEAFVNTARRLTIGDPLNNNTFMGPVISQPAMHKVLGYNDLARKEGVTVLLDGGRLSGKDYDRGYFLSPFIYQTENRPGMRCIREEVFGPHVAVIPFRTLEEAAFIFNDVEYGFSLAIITEDYRKARFLREECEFGVGYVNLPTIGAEVHLPFGGLKKSGSGLPSGATLIDVVTHRIAWTINHDREIKLAQGLSAEIT